MIAEKSEIEKRKVRRKVCDLSLPLLFSQLITLSQSPLQISLGRKGGKEKMRREKKKGQSITT
jgi:hypothetical protein